MSKVAALTPAPYTLPTHKTEPRPSPAPLSSPRKSQTWVPFAVAASLLLTVGTSSFWYFSRDTANSALNSNNPPLASRSGAADPAWDNWLPAGGVPPTAPMPAEKGSKGVFVQHSPVTPGSVERDPVAVAPMPQEGRDPLFAPLSTPTHLDLVQVRVPFLKPLADFDREDIRQQLKEELARDPAFRIDIFTRDSARAVQFFQTAAKAARVPVYADTATMALVAKRQTTTSIVVYIESLTATELTDLFAKLNAEDAKISPRVFDVLHATPVVKSDEAEMRSILGIDPGLFKRTVPAPERRDNGMDSAKSISADTADQIVRSIATGQGKLSEKSAMLMTWGPSNVRTIPANSGELKSFLTKRGERKPNAVPVIIVIRHGNG